VQDQLASQAACDYDRVLTNLPSISHLWGSAVPPPRASAKSKKQETRRAIRASYGFDSPFPSFLPIMPRNSQPEFYLLVVAHPDDESMFFSPTICSLLEQQQTIHILSLSNGNFDGLGKTREVELMRAAGVLGISPPNKYVTCLDVRHFQDGPKETWKAGAITDAVWAEISRILQNDVPRNESLAANDRRSCCNVAIITFDENGVSGHPNHIDVCKGLRQMASEDRTRKIHDMNVSLCVWELDSITNPLTKYCPLMEWIPMLVDFLWGIFCSSLAFIVASGQLGNQKVDGRLRFIEASSEDYGRTTWDCKMFRPLSIWRAMAAHHSQFVWYRRLSVLFSRFSYRNKLKLYVPIDRLQNRGVSKKAE